MKKMMFSTAFVLAVLIFACSGRAAAQQNTGPAALMLNHYAARNFTVGAISQADLDIIVQAGIRAPSAMNRQPWIFTVVQNYNLGKQLVSNLVEGNVLIVVSTRGDGRTNVREILDCALAVQSIYLAAQALGYGARIYTGPVDTINGRFKDELGLQSSYSAVALVRVGKTGAAVDSVSAASSRKSTEDLVRYIK